MRKSFSNDYLKIQRLQGVILFPANIRQITVRGKVQFEYDELLIEDTGQDISDRDTFVKANWALLRTAMYAGREVLPVREGMWDTFREDVKDSFQTTGENMKEPIERIK